MTSARPNLEYLKQTVPTWMHPVPLRQQLLIDYADALAVRSARLRGVVEHLLEVYDRASSNYMFLDDFFDMLPDIRAALAHPDPQEAP